MKQSQYRYLGLLDLVLVSGLIAVFGVAVLGTAPIVLMGLAGAGSVSAVSVGVATVTWRHLIGVSYVPFVLVWPAIYAPDVVTGTISGQNLLVFVVATVGALSLVFYGIDIARGGGISPSPRCRTDARRMTRPTAIMRRLYTVLPTMSYEFRGGNPRL